MATSTKAASSNAVVTTGWTNPTNAYASDNVYATAVPAAGADVTTDYGFANFATGDIPDGAFISGIVATAEAIGASSVTVGVRIYKNGTAVGTEATTNSTTEVTISTPLYATVTLDDLRNASTRLKARARASRSGTSATASLDYVSLTATYTAANANLSALSLSGATLSPTFAAGTTSYTTTVAYVNGSPTLAATAEVGNSTIQYRVNGGTYSSAVTASLSTTISLPNTGATTNTVDVLVTDGLGNTKTYTITVTRTAADTNADLSALAFTNAVLTPTFSASTTSYSSSVPFNLTSTTLSATRSSSLSTALEYRLNGGSWTSFAGTGSVSLTLQSWGNTVEVRVTAESGAQKTYTTTIVRVAAYQFQTLAEVNGISVTQFSATFSRWQTLYTIAGTHRWYNDSGATLAIKEIRAAVGTAPTGATIICDVNIDGSTIWSTQGNRLTIAANGNTASTTTFNTLVIPDGSYLTVDIDQVGSTEPGADLTLTVWMERLG